jgi:hypothetical protein
MNKKEIKVILIVKGLKQVVLKEARLRFSKPKRIGAYVP